VSSWKTVLTGGMRRSVCRVWFVTYRGAFVIGRRVFAWYSWITAKLEAAVQPHIAWDRLKLSKNLNEIVYIWFIFYINRTGSRRNANCLCIPIFNFITITD
jgi:hypothetical protein